MPVEVFWYLEWGVHIVVDVVFVVIIAYMSVGAVFECPQFCVSGVVNGWPLVDIMNTELCIYVWYSYVWYVPLCSMKLSI